MGLFGLLNYEDYILNTVAKSSYARNSLVIGLIYIITAIVRFHLAVLICYLFTWNPLFDFIFPVAVNVLLSMSSDTLFKYVETHRPRYEQWVDYLMTNYSKENFIRWKRFLIVGVCCYVLLAISLIQIDNYFIFVSIIQTASSFGICDSLENKLPLALYNKMVDWWHRPRVIKSADGKSVIGGYSPYRSTGIFLSPKHLIEPSISVDSYGVTVQPRYPSKDKNRNSTIVDRKKGLRRSLDSITPLKSIQSDKLDKKYLNVKNRTGRGLRHSQTIRPTFIIKKDGQQEELTERASPILPKPLTPPTLLPSRLPTPPTLLPSELQYRTPDELRERAYPIPPKPLTPPTLLPSELQYRTPEELRETSYPIPPKSLTPPTSLQSRPPTPHYYHPNFNIDHQHHPHKLPSKPPTPPTIGSVEPSTVIPIRLSTIPPEPRTPPTIKLYAN